jgi:hypothetical protein
MYPNPEEAKNTIGADPMKSRPLKFSFITLVAITLLSFGASFANAGPKDFETFTLDVAVDFNTFAIVPSTGLVAAPEATGPNRGTPFIVDGKVFAGGTLQKGAGMGDPNMPGSIGSWICKGIFTSDLMTDDVGFNTTQMFLLNGDMDAIWTEGLEAGLGKQGVITHRIILGGTGKFRGVQGEVVQEALGTNDLGTPNIRLTFKVQRGR